MAKKGRRLWCKLNAHGGIVKVYVVKEVTLDSGTRCDAAHDQDKNEIEVAQTADINFMKSKLLHELLHLCFYPYSLDVLEDVLIGKDKDKRDEHEENIVSHLEVPLYTILTQNKLLRIPNPPKLA